MKKSDKLLLALGTIALGAVVPATSASAQEEATTCEWLSQRTPSELRDFLRDNPNNSCVEVAARMLVERTQPAQAAGRY